MKKILKILVILLTLTVINTVNVNAEETNMAEKEIIKEYLDTNNNKILTIYKQNNELYYEANKDINGFYEIESNLYYLNSNDKKVTTGFKTINYKTYYFDENGVSKRGLIKQNSSCYYLTTKNKLLKSDWITINGYTYYFGGNNKGYKGWHTLSKKTYYFTNECQMRRGWEVINNKTYYFGNNGVMRTYWQTINNKTYYFGYNGIVRTGFKTINNKTYYFDENGVSKRGLIKDNTSYYYLTTKNKLLKSEWITINGYTYYFGGNSKGYKGWHTLSGKTYYFSQSCKMRRGWEIINNNTYYFNDYMYTGKRLVKNTYYYFGTDGILIDGFKVIDNETYYYDANNKKVIGWIWIKGKKYFFNSKGQLIKENAKKVIDVSEWQGNIDWETVKSKGDIDAVILRLGYSGSDTWKPYIDAKFLTNAKKLKELNIPFGIYYYGYGTTITQAKRESDFVINTLKNNNIKPTYPVFYDAEVAKITKSQYSSLIPEFIKKINAVGYKTGVYGNMWALTNSYLSSSNIRSYPIWVAQYATKCTYTGKYIGWQYTSDGTVPGISGRVDMNVW